MKTQSKRLSQISNIRVLSIFLVVLGHSIILYSTSWGLYTTTRGSHLLAYLKQLINIVQMPLFFSLSGYLFVFSHAKKKGKLALLKSKTRRLLLPYLMIGLFYLFPLRMLIQYPGYQGKSISELMMNVVTVEDMGHLWFLPTLFLVFLLAELLLTLGEHLPGFRKHPDWFLYLGVVVLYLEGYRISFGYGPLRSAYIYLLWFTCGYFLHCYHTLLRKIYKRSYFKVLLIALNLVLTISYINTEQPDLLLSLGVPFLFLLNIYGLTPEKSCTIVEKIDRNSFGIYLFHSPLVYITFAMIPNALPLLVVFINLVIFGTVSYALTVLMRRWKLAFVIGE